MECSHQSGLLQKTPQYMSWTCASEQVIMFLVGMGQHSSGLDLKGVNVFAAAEVSEYHSSQAGSH